MTKFIMNIYNYPNLFLPFILIIVQFVVCLSCPFEALVNPFGCECDYGLNGKWLSCQSDKLSTVINLLSDHLKENQTEFDELYVESNSLSELGENLLRNISFKVITFHNCSRLKTIHENAFKNVESKITKFEISGQNQLSDESIFTIISRMINLRSLRLSDTKLTSIPEYAFNPINGLQKNLTRISFDTSCSGSPIRKVMKRAFFHLPNLIHLDLSCLQLQEIDSHAFQFENSSNPTKLFIDLSQNQLTENSFQDNFVNASNRSVELILNYNPFKYLNQSIFGSFLDSNPENKLTIWQSVKNSKINCSSCQMNWLKAYEQQIDDTFCSDRQLFKNTRKSVSECPISPNRKMKCND